MREITASGQTVDEAIKSALEQLNIAEEQAEVEIIDEGKKGFLGIFGSARAVVKVKEKKDIIATVEDYLKNIANNLGVHIDVEVVVDNNHITFNMSGEEIALLIGKRGKTLNAIQYLTQLVLNKDGRQFHSVTVDAEGYRKRREETLIDLAHKMANKATRIRKKVTLEPMPAFERKIIHSALQDLPDIGTSSEGSEPYRHIIIIPQNK